MSIPPIRVAAGTTNPAKIEAIRRAAQDLLGAVLIEPVEVDPNVPDQPWGDDETARGALARAQRALETCPAATYGIGVESGLADGPGGRIYVISWSAAVDRTDGVGYGASERFAVPARFEFDLRTGVELGPLLDRLLGQPGLARREGVVSVITEGRRNRSEILAIAVLHSLLSLVKR